MNELETELTKVELTKVELTKPKSELLVLTKREHFAGLAMQGLLAVGYCKDVPSAAINFADDLLKALEQKVLDIEAAEPAYVRELKLANGALVKHCELEQANE